MSDDEKMDPTVGLSLVFHAAARLVSRPRGQVQPNALPAGMMSVSDPTAVDGTELANLVRACNEFTRWSLYLEPPTGWQEVIKDAFLEGRYDDAVEILMMEYLVIDTIDPELTMVVTKRADGKRVLRFDSKATAPSEAPRISTPGARVFCNVCSFLHQSPACDRG